MGPPFSWQHLPTTKKTMGSDAKTVLRLRRESKLQRKVQTMAIQHFSSSVFLPGEDLEFFATDTTV